MAVTYPHPRPRPPRWGYRTCRVAGFVPCMPWYALLIRTWACYSEPGQPRPRTEQTAHVRNSGFTCGTRWSPGHCRTQPIHDGSWGSHTQARDAAFTGTRQTQPTKIVTFPRNKAEKSLQNQHVLSFNPRNLSQTKGGGRIGKNLGGTLSGSTCRQLESLRKGVTPAMQPKLVIVPGSSRTILAQEGRSCLGREHATGTPRS